MAYVLVLAWRWNCLNETKRRLAMPRWGVLAALMYVRVQDLYEQLTDNKRILLMETHILFHTYSSVIARSAGSVGLDPIHT